jgi:hypothetical protein
MKSQNGNDVLKKDKRKKLKVGGEITYNDAIKDWTQCCFLLPIKMK